MFTPLLKMLSKVESLTEMAMSAMLLCLCRDRYGDIKAGNCFVGCDGKERASLCIYLFVIFLTVFLEVCRHK